MAIEVAQSLSDAGAAEKPNEDRFGALAGGSGAFVIDGATGLGDTRLARAEGSDAAWLADWTRARWTAQAGVPPDAAAEAIIAETCAAFADALAADLRGAGGGALPDVPRYALPTAGFQWLRERADGALETAGLGDCVLFVQDAAARFRRVTGMRRTRGFEQTAARAALAATGGLGAGTVRHPAVLAGLRAARSTHNTPNGSVWTLGVSPDAAAHVVREDLDLQRPATALLATDGFADLVDLYEAYDGPGLIAAAQDRGLAALVAELRHLEHEVDPKGARFARFKRSDDATAMLLRAT